MENNKTKLSSTEKSKIKKDFIDHAVYGKTVSVEETLRLKETMELDNVEAFAGLKIAPNIVIPPMTRDELADKYMGVGVPIKLYNHLKRLSDYKLKQIRSNDRYQVVSGNVYGTGMQLDRERTDRAKDKMLDNGLEVIDILGKNL